MPPNENLESASAAPGWFTTTHWTVVLQAKEGDTTRSVEALGKLCQSYWAPVHAYIRQVGRGKDDTEDLTQQFFARFLEKEHYKLAERERGRFRSFLLTAVKNFLVNEWARASAQKRGGGKPLLSLDEEIPDEGTPRIEIADDQTAERIYEQKWALTLLAQVRAKLEKEYTSDGKAERFTQLEQFLPGEESAMTYAQAAERLGVAEGTIKSDVHRLKRRYRELLRAEIANTVNTPAEINEELRHLIRVLGQR